MPAIPEQASQLLRDIQEHDRSGMLSLIIDLPGQVEEALQICGGVDLSALSAQVRNVCICGMGGSAIGGDLIGACVADELKRPFFVNRNYTLPGFVGDGSLVVVCSYSGNTEETLAAYEAANARQAQIVCITGGGALGERADANGHTLIRLPGGQPPRSALGYLAIPVVHVLHAARLISDRSHQIAEMVAVLETLRERLRPESSNNPANEIATQLQGGVPLIYADTALAPVVARWRGQLCENSKMLAFGNVFPELNHNEIVGWGQGKLDRLFRVVLLRDKAESPGIRRRMALTEQIIGKHGTPVIQVESTGQSVFARFFSLTYLADFVSFYLAIHNEVDPGSIENIDLIKAGLRDS